MPDTSPILALPLLQPAQAQKHVTVNEALLLLEAAVQLVVEDRSRTAPPAEPGQGQRHLVAPGAVGDWAGQEGAVAVFDSGLWRFVPPAPGWWAEVRAEGRQVVWTGSVWEIRQPDLDQLPGLGIGTAHDAVNRLALAAEASLFSHAGAGHQLKVNKATPADTASLLFQTNWSGRAEMGLSGSDAWALKVSAEGSAWIEALAVDGATGHVSGAAVQASASDVTPGRLMRADYGYSRGNLLGEVSQSGGQPTGAAIQSGSTANGSFLRLADGTQICTHSLTMLAGAYNNVGGTWTFAQPFVGTPSVSLTAPNSGSDYINCSASQFGLCRQGSGGVSVVLNLTGITPIDPAAQVRNVRVSAIGRWI